MAKKSAADLLRPIHRGTPLMAQQLDLNRRMTIMAVSGLGVYTDGEGTYLLQTPRAMTSNIDWIVAWGPSLNDADSPNVWVKSIVPTGTDPWNGKFELAEQEPVEIACYPGYLQFDFMRLAVNGGESLDVRGEDQAHLAVMIKGVWYAWPHAKLDWEEISVLQRVRVSDCDIRTSFL